MNLVRVNETNDLSPHYLNMDYIVRLGKDKDGNYWACTSEYHYFISESAYNAILKYGKAKI
jgi:hypothetical protein